MLKKLIVPFGFAFWAISQSTLAQAPMESVPGELLVKFRPGSELAARAARLAIGAEKTGGIAWLGIDKVTLPEGMSDEQGLAYFRRNPSVVFVERNGIWRSHLTPNDPLFPQQYQHTKIQTPAAWDLNRGNASIVIAILDSGVDLSHLDLSSKLVPGFDFVNNDSNPQDDDGHGTHVAGLAAAATNNGLGVAGSGFDCKIMPVKVLNQFGGATFEWVANGIGFATANGAKVINMSLGGPSNSATVEAAVNQAVAQGIVVVASAGNNGDTNPNYPGFLTPCIAVASTNAQDQRSGFSTFGSWVDVAAPGDQVISTLLGGSYGAESGTSMSAPVTAGVVGLIWAHSPPGTTNAQVRATLENTCDPVGPFVAKGRINAFKALNSLGTFVDVNAVPTAVNVHTGTYLSGNLASVQALDSNFHQVRPVNVPSQGTVAAASMDFSTGENLASANRFSFTLNGQAATGVTGMFYLYNWSSGQFVHVKSFPFKGAAAPAVTIDAPKPYSQWSSGGNVRILFRAIAPLRTRLNYVLGTDRAQMTVRKRVN